MTSQLQQRNDVINTLQQDSSPLPLSPLLFLLFAQGPKRQSEESLFPVVNKKRIRMERLIESPLQRAPGITTLRAATKAQLKKHMRAPPELTEVLEKFTNSAIKAQPIDLLKWTKTYFDDVNIRLAHSVKEKLRGIPSSQLTLVTPELLRVLHANVAGNPTVDSSELRLIWMRLDLPGEVFEKLITAGQFSDQTEWLKFLALTCYCLGKQTITAALKIACEVLSSTYRGQQPRIPFSTFQFLYQYLACVDENVSASRVRRSLKCLRRKIIGSDGLIKVSDFMYNPRIRLE